MTGRSWLRLPCLILPGDTAEALAARVLAQEHRLYPAALAAHAQGGLATLPDAGAALSNPLPGLRPPP